MALPGKRPLPRPSSRSGWSHLHRSCSPLVLLAIIVICCVPAVPGQNYQCKDGLCDKPVGYEYIDCGADEVVTDAPNGEYSFMNGTLGPDSAVYQVLPLNLTTTGSLSSWSFPGLKEDERTLRSFPPDRVGCYWIPVQPGRYNVRLGWAYYNYDGLKQYPKFNVSLAGTDVDTVDLGLLETEHREYEGYEGADLAPTGGAIGQIHYGEYVYGFLSTTAIICLKSIDGSRPILNTIELIPYMGEVIPEIDIFVPPPTPWTLTLRHRIKLGGPAIKPEEDPLWRRWGGQTPRTALQFLAFGQDSQSGQVWEPQYTNLTDPDPKAEYKVMGFMRNASVPQFPDSLFRSALQGGNLTDGTKFLGIRLPYKPLDPTNHLLARLFFREMGDTVYAADMRVFNVTFTAALPTNDTVSATTTYERAHWLPPAFSYFFDTFVATHAEGNYTDPANNGTTTGPDSDPSSSGVTGNPAFYIAQAGCSPVATAPGEVVLLNLFLRCSSMYPLPPMLSGVELYEIITQTEDLEPCKALQEPHADPSNTTFPSTSNEDAELPPPAFISAGAVAGITLACLVVAAGVGAAAFILRRRWREERMIQEFHKFRATLD